jgi:hypothetical protein
VILRRLQSSRKHEAYATIRRMPALMPLFVGSLLLLYSMLSHPTVAIGQTPFDFPATTEQSCSFGMAKGEPSHQCQVPIPESCLVAKAPGTKKPWTTISKGGKMSCRFDEKKTDWKTKITGTCGRCSTEQCSVQFSVRFDCNPH